MVYFTKNKYNSNWINEWITLYKILSNEISSTEGTNAVTLSAEIQNLVNTETTITSHIIDKINNLIINFTENIKGGSLLKDRKKISTYKYKIKKTRKKNNKSKKLKRK
tara:strand:+ start:615 stop:938 length:324 start_codon:yes stop_codon:yes gene_type:complete